MDSWEHHQKLVLHELESLNKKVESLDNKQDKMREDIITLKTKAKMWGAVTGTLVTAVLSALELFYKYNN